MAGARVNNYSNIDTNILAMQLTQDRAFIGYESVIFDSAGIIQAGSAIECAGTLYEFTSNETPTGSGDYMYIVPNGATCTVEKTSTAPVYSNTKNGWYGVSSYASYRYLPIYQLCPFTPIKHRFYPFIKAVFDGATTFTTTPGPLGIDNAPVDVLSEVSTASDQITIAKSGFYRILTTLYSTCSGSAGWSFGVTRTSNAVTTTLDKSTIVAATQYNITLNYCGRLNEGDIIKVACTDVWGYLSGNCQIYSAVYPNSIGLNSYKSDILIEQIR